MLLYKHRLIPDACKKFGSWVVVLNFHEPWSRGSPKGISRKCLGRISVILEGHSWFHDSRTEWLVYLINMCIRICTLLITIHIITCTILYIFITCKLFFSVAKSPLPFGAWWPFPFYLGQQMMGWPGVQYGLWSNHPVKYIILYNNVYSFFYFQHVLLVECQSHCLLQQTLFVIVDSGYCGSVDACKILHQLVDGKHLSTNYNPIIFISSGSYLSFQ